LLWARTFTDDRLLQAVTLRQFEFLAASMYGDCERCRLKWRKTGLHRETV